jgi:hypothetical protein
MKKIIVGWREYIRLPDLFATPIKCKVDTGAASSALHAQLIDVFEKENIDGSHQTMVRFLFFPEPGAANNDVSVEQVAPLLEFRKVRSSSGHISRRPVIITTAHLDEIIWPIEITLANRGRMEFPMLLGREAMRGRFIVDPNRSFISRRKDKPQALPES